MISSSSPKWLWSSGITSLWLCLGMLIISASLSGQQERIIHYDVKVEIQKDRSIIVTEFIEVYVGGNIFQRGIIRNLPKSRVLKDRRVQTHYDIIEVVKDGQPEPYHQNTQGQDIILYLGDSDVLLDPGIYRYRIKYRASDQIAFFKDYDEIYWNAIGHQNLISVEQASASIYLPKGADIIQESAYTGRLGDTSKDYIVSEELGGIVYKTTRSLRPGEGMTISIGFSKGYINTPSFLHRYGTIIVVIMGFLMLIPYYVITWWRHGQDPPTPPSVPDWHTPDGLSSASINYVQNGSYDTKGFTASIIDLAIKGYLKIEEQVEHGFFSKKKSFDLIKIKDASLAADIPSEEKVLLETLFHSNHRVSVAGDYDRTIEETYAIHKANLQMQHDDLLNEGNNTRFLWVPILMTIGVIVVAVLLMNNAYAASSNIKALLVFGVIGVLGFLLYGYLIRQPTVKKLSLRSRIKGYKMYLEMAEKERLNVLNPPSLTPEYFEAVLPYAFALGVEHKWSGRFKDILDKTQYRPEWHNSADHIYFSTHFGRNFSSQISSAATPPPPKGSSSGSGGGGFSGGGGGGGGVGGW